MGPASLGGSCERGKVSTHYETPSLAGTVWGSLEPQRRVQQQEFKGQSGEIPTQRISADQHSPA